MAKNTLTERVGENVGLHEEGETTTLKCTYSGCRKPLSEDHYVSRYGGHYCNETCLNMFTED